MFHKLKIYSAKRALRNRMNNWFSTKNSPSEKIGVLLDYDVIDEGFDIVKFRKDLGFSYENFEFLICAKNKKIADKYSLDQFNGQNLGWKGVFNEGSREKKFQDTKYKMVLNYFVAPPPEMLLLSASLNAKYKVGFPSEYKDLNNVEINVNPKDVFLFTQELKKYLQWIEN